MAENSPVRIAHQSEIDSPQDERPLVRICKAPIHGTGHAYRRHKCRCRDAMLEIIEKQKEWRRRKAAGAPPVLMDSTATHRMLKALMAAGWTSEELSKRLGHSTREGAIQLLRSKRVHPSTHARISALYDELQLVPGASKRTRDRMLKKGAAPPMAWDDITDPEAEPAGVRAEAGRKCQKAYELIYEYQFIRDSGMSHEYALAELGVTHDTWWKASKTMGLTSERKKAPEKEPARRQNYHINPLT